MSIILDYHTDPAHGWLAVPFDTLRSLKVDVTKVTAFSYMNRREGMAYLEEDCDAGIVLDAAREAGIDVKIVTVHTNNYSPIRNLPSFVGVYEADYRAKSRRPRACDL